MKIVIDIDEKDYEFIKSVNSIMKNSDTFQRIATDLFKAVQEAEVSKVKKITYHWDVDTSEVSYVTDEVE